MILLKPYKDINETMYYLYLQIKDSLKFADQWLPGYINTPEKLYALLKQNTHFVNDGENEKIQSMQTLLTKNNIWKIPGAGDCDCCVVTATACMCILNFPCKIVLAGREQKAPVHIYNLVLDDGAWTPFDLTNRFYKEMRKYQYVQILPRLN